jgi:hypothetical protein
MTEARVIELIPVVNLPRVVELITVARPLAERAACGLYHWNSDTERSGAAMDVRFSIGAGGLNVTKSARVNDASCGFAGRRPHRG